VGVWLHGQEPTGDDPLEELRGLATTAGARVAGSLTQRRDKPDIATYLGKGKVEELTELVAAKDADVVIFDNDLTPAQTRNLERAVNTKVLDRTELILDIFATRARTHEARLQVELAQLEYALPRLKRMWTHLSRLKAGIGMRGPGEQQLEEDRRLVTKRIGDLKAKLSRVQARKEREVASRTEMPTVSLVGYTNAGKSTLMNRLTGAGVLVEDKLFATLDTRTRKWDVADFGPVLLSDTVGFIRDLPHHLVASFKATLEEVHQASLLLHVVDVSNPEAEHQMEAVRSILAELGCADRPTLLVLNKADAVSDPSMLDVIRARHGVGIAISAARGWGIEPLEAEIARILGDGMVDAEIEVSAGNGKLLAFLESHADIRSRDYVDSRVALQCRMPQRFLDQIPMDEAAVRVHSHS